MALQSSKSSANSPTLKRSFLAVSKSDSTSPDPSIQHHSFKVPALPSKAQAERHMSFFPRRRQASEYPSSNMSSAAGPRAYQNHFPSFMSVYSIDASNVENEKVPAATMGDARLVPLPSTKGGAINQNVRSESESQPQPHHTSQTSQAYLQHQHRDSTSTQASESTDSSPTTTISTADSSSLTDPSPSSSPESPITIVPLSSFASTTFGIHSLDDLTMSETPSDKPPMSNDNRPLTSPAPRKPRNAKGLALKLPSVAADSPQRTSAPSSPSFVKPPPPKPRKKPSILSLQTSAHPGLNNNISRFEPPPTPHDVRRTVLRHHVSSPNMALFSPDPRGGSAPQGGMQLPPLERSRVTGLSNAFRKPSTLKDSNIIGTEHTIDEEDSPIRAQLANHRDSNIGGDAFDHRESHEDSVGKGYPNGPIMMYEPNVYLYLEPTLEEASRFDVVVNVAKEVKNPFATPVPTAEQSNLTFDPMDVDRDNIPIPDTAATTATYKTAFEFPQTDSQTPTETSPTTPKPGSKNEPEYIHVPWEHNTDILPDLMNLCETIDSRAREGKRVLVHCQQGASRSASLIIAYGMYKNPSLSATQAYEEAKAKSEAVNPNMGLVFSLNKFGQELNEKRKQNQGGLRRNPGRSPHRTTVSADAIDLMPKEPLSAPLPPERENTAQDEAENNSPSRPRGNSTPNLPDVSPGPSSAPSSYIWTPRLDNSGAPLQSFPTEATVLSQEPAYASRTSDGNALDGRLQAAAAAATAAAACFSSHRHHHTPGVVLPSLSNTITPPQPFGTSLPSTSSTSTIHTQHILDHRPLAPESPGLWSPRLAEMTGASSSTGAFTWGSSSSASGFTGNGNDHGNGNDIVEPPTPSAIMSPRVAEFNISPFGGMHFDHPSHASSSFHANNASHQRQQQLPYQQQQRRPSAFGFGSLVAGGEASVPSTTTGSGNVTTVGAVNAPANNTPRAAEDPRSPATKGEVPIIRSIDEML